MICVLSQSNVWHFTTKQCSVNALRTCQTNKHIDTLLHHRRVSVQQRRWGRCPFWGRITLLLRRRRQKVHQKNFCYRVCPNVSDVVNSNLLNDLTLPTWSFSSPLYFLRSILFTNVLLWLHTDVKDQISLHSATWIVPQIRVLPWWMKVHTVGVTKLCMITSILHKYTVIDHCLTQL